MAKPRTDLRCGKCERWLAFVAGSWRHTDDGSLLCHFAIPYADPPTEDAPRYGRRVGEQDQPKGEPR